MSSDRQHQAGTSSNSSLALPDDWPAPKFQFGQKVRLLPDQEIHQVIGLVCRYFKPMAHLPCKGYAWFYLLDCSSEFKQLLFDEDELTAVRDRPSNNEKGRTKQKKASSRAEPDCGYRII